MLSSKIILGRTKLYINSLSSIVINIVSIAPSLSETSLALVLDMVTMFYPFEIQMMRAKPQMDPNYVLVPFLVTALSANSWTSMS